MNLPWEIRLNPLDPWDPEGQSHHPRATTFWHGGYDYNGGDDSEGFDGDLHTLIRTGQTFGDYTFGQVINDKEQKKWLHWAMDYSGLLYKNGRIWMLSHFEARIGMLYLTEVEQNLDTGELTPVKTVPLLPHKYIHPNMKFMSAPVSGVTTPWNTFLSLLEYPFDPKWLNDPDLTGDDICFDWKFGSSRKMYPHFDETKSTVYEFFDRTCDPSQPVEDLKTEFLSIYGSQYWNGVVFEVDVRDGTKDPWDVTMTVHWSMGRASWERPVVMPDNKTVYLSSDMYTDSLYMFKADLPNDLSSGHLYAIKMTQVDGVGDLLKAEWSVEWLNMGHASDKDFNMNHINSYSPSDFFDIVEIDANGSCRDGYAASEMHKIYPANTECVRLTVTGDMEKIASRLETQRYAAWLGATQELSKVEGITLGDHENRVHFALSYVEKGMLDGSTTDPESWDFGGNNDIRVQGNSYGCIFTLWLDTSYQGEYIDVLSCGSEETYQNPDNIEFTKHHGLLISEDSYRGGDTRITNFAWKFDTDKDTVIPILQGVNGAQIAMGYYYWGFGEGRKKWNYLVWVIQHPYKGYNLPEGCDPLGENPQCGDFTGTGDWLVYLKWPQYRCQELYRDMEGNNVLHSASWESHEKYWRSYWSWYDDTCPSSDSTVAAGSNDKTLQNVFLILWLCTLVAALAGAAYSLFFCVQKADIVFMSENLGQMKSSIALAGGMQVDSEQYKKVGTDDVDVEPANEI